MKRNAIVTGGSRGIGKEIAEILAKNGYNVLITYVKSNQLANEFVENLQKKYKVKAICYKADMSNIDEVDQLVRFAIKTFKHIDVLINNAAVCMDEEFEARTVGQFVKTFEINLFSVFELSKKVGEHMFENQYGKIVNRSSNNSINSFYPTTIDYDASKSALNSLTKNLAIQFAPYVNVNAVAPGWIDTDMNKKVLTPDIAELVSEKILKRRIGKPIDVANLVEFLVSDKADYIDGEIIVIDGGMF